MPEPVAGTSCSVLPVPGSPPINLTRPPSPPLLATGEVVGPPDETDQSRRQISFWAAVSSFFTDCITDVHNKQTQNQKRAEASVVGEDGSACHLPCGPASGVLSAAVLCKDGWSAWGPSRKDRKVSAEEPRLWLIFVSPLTICWGGSPMNMLHGTAVLISHWLESESYGPKFFLFFLFSTIRSFWRNFYVCARYSVKHWKCRGM